MAFTYLSQVNWRIFIAVKINSDQKERIYKAFKTMFNNSPEAAIQRCSYKKELYLKTLKNFTQLYWNCTSVWMFSCKFAAYFQNTFSQEQFRTAASDSLIFCKISIFEVSAFVKVPQLYFGICKKSILKTNNFAPIIATTQGKNFFLKKLEI